MAQPVKVSCPRCKEGFTYAPSDKILEQIRGFQLKIGRPAAIWIQCVHCDAVLEVDMKSSRAKMVDHKTDPNPKNGIMFDMTFFEKHSDEVAKRISAGNAHMAKGDLSKAKQSFQEAIDLGKHLSLPWYNLGVCLSGEKAFQEAADAFRHAVRFNEKFSQAWSNLGFSLIRLAEPKWDEADACFDKAISTDGNYAKPYLGKGNIELFGRKNPKKARQCFEKALKIDPGYAAAKQNIDAIDRIQRGL
jgi:tetratricopeptide (TPR) repeat protein